jgi:hypothetical protein
MGVDAFPIFQSIFSALDPLPTKEHPAPISGLIWLNRFSSDVVIHIIHAPSTFSAKEIKDLPEFVNKLTRHSDPLSSFLWERFSETLTNYKALPPNTNVLEALVVSQLNEVIAGPSIYERGRFQQVSLRPETTNLIEQSPGGTNRASVNRMLLEDAYPAELSRTLIYTNSEESISLRKSTLEHHDGFDVIYIK